MFSMMDSSSGSPAPPGPRQLLSSLDKLTEDSVCRAFLDAITTGDLRRMLRTRCPQTMGRCSADALKDECIDVLLGAITPEQLIEKQLEAMKLNPANSDEAEEAAGYSVRAAVDAGNSVANGVTINGVDTPPEGVGGDNPPDSQSHVLIDGKDPVDWAIDLMGTLGKQVAQERITRLRDEGFTSSAAINTLKQDLADARATMAPVEQHSITGDGQQIEFRGEKFDILSDGVDERIPVADQYFDPSIWRSRSKVAGGMVEFDAKDLLRMLLAGVRVNLVGPPGCGKTKMVEYLCAIVGWPFFRFNGHRDLDLMDLTGQHEARKAETIFVESVLPQAMTYQGKGGLLLLDEWDRMQGQMSIALNPVLEPKGKLVLTSDSARVVSPGEMFNIVGATNTQGFGNNNARHAAAQVQDSALIDRFDVALRVDYPASSGEQRLLKRVTGIDSDQAQKIVKTANLTREAGEAGRCDTPIGLRGTIAWAKMSVMFGDPRKAYIMTCIDKVSPLDRQAFVDAAQRVWGDDLKV